MMKFSSKTMKIAMSVVLVGITGLMLTWAAVTRLEASARALETRLAVECPQPRWLLRLLGHKSLPAPTPLPAPWGAVPLLGRLWAARRRLDQLQAFKPAECPSLPSIRSLVAGAAGITAVLVVLYVRRQSPLSKDGHAAHTSSEQVSGLEKTKAKKTTFASSLEEGVSGPVQFQGNAGLQEEAPGYRASEEEAPTLEEEAPASEEETSGHTSEEEAPACEEGASGDASEEEAHASEEEANSSQEVDLRLTTTELPAIAAPLLLPLPRLSPADREDILCGRWLSDDVIDLGQQVVQRAFPEILGLYACGAAFTLPPLLPGDESLFVQVVNRSTPRVVASLEAYGRPQGTHWITLTNYVAAAGELRVFDSLYREVSQSTAELVHDLLSLHERPRGAVLPSVQRQTDGHSCGLFALAFAFSVALGEDPTTLRYDHSKMAAHLLTCLEEGQMFGWVPDVYTSLDDLPEHMPQCLQDHITERTSQNHGVMPKLVWLSCEGEDPHSKETIGSIQYSPWQGFPAYYFPYTNAPGCLPPIVAVQFRDLLSHVLINVKCRAWAKNIFHDRQNRLGLIHFELLKD